MNHSHILLESGTNELEIVEFYLDEEIPGLDAPYRGYYGVNVAKVLEIIKAPSKVVELPDANNHAIRGAFNLRSTIIPLIDLHRWLDKKKPPVQSANAIVTEFNEIVNAFLISGVTRIHRIGWDEVEPPSKYLASFSNDNITGVVHIENKIIFLLDLEKIITDLNPGMRLKEKPSVPSNRTEHYKALVVDDSAVIRSMLKSFLVEAHFDVEMANNGQEAWDRLLEIKQQAINEHKRPIDLLQIVISDIEMPKVDGMNLTKRIKSDIKLQTLPVILFSSLVTERLRHKGEAVGADDQISKPEVDQLAQRSEALIESYLKRDT